MTILKKIVKSIFFWTKKGDNELPSIEKMLELYVKHIPLIKKAMDRANADSGSDNGGDFLKRMYDFWIGWENRVMDDDAHTIAIPPQTGSQELKDGRKEKKPIEVLAELETIQMEIKLKDLDKKIMLFKGKSHLIKKRFTKKQVEGFIKRLENRRHYDKHKEFFVQFPSTNDEKIGKLLETYKLVMEESDLFVPTFPKAAIDIMTKYSEVTKQFTDEAHARQFPFLCVVL